MKRGREGTRKNGTNGEGRKERLIVNELFHQFISRTISFKDKARRFIVNLRSTEKFPRP